MTARSAGFDLREQDGARILALTGDWTVWTIADIEARWREALAARADAPVHIALDDVGAVDVAGAYLINAGGERAEITGGDEGTTRLLEVARAATASKAKSDRHEPGIVLLLDRIGRAAIKFAEETLATLSFLGLSVVVLGRALILRPHRIRWAAVFQIMESAGLNATPIIVALSVFVGVVVGYLGASALADFGQTLLTVELVSASVLQEFAAIITAVLLAGRTDSAFTAEIGAMKMRQEIDALRVLGLDPVETLVVPRLIAMTLMMPILTFVAMMAGLAGGMLVCWFHLDISPVLFITRLENLPEEYFWMGIIKTPFIGFVLAQVGCRHGLQTGADVTSLGARVTSSVVQAIFLAIVIDMVFAIWLREVFW
jgi:phospholipid/cholesterol/gamma-HCH transport system permease protein